MFRSYMHGLTLAVFAVGLGIGISWSRGLIPLTVGPAKTGSLGLDVTQRETLPPPDNPSLEIARRNRNAGTDSAPDDTTIFEQQSEPGGRNVASTDEEPVPAASRNRIIRASRSMESAEQSSETRAERSNELQRDTLRVRDRAAVRLDPSAGIETADSPPSRKPVTRVAHQDPAESANDADSRDATPPLSPREQLSAAEVKLAAGETLAGHRDLSKLYWNHKDFRPQMQDTIDRTAKSIFLQSQPHFVSPYVIQSGDRLEVIAKKYSISWEYLAKLNHTNPKRIQIDQKLKVVKGPFGAVIDLADFALTVHLQGYYVKRYDVGIGKDGASPIGKFAVLNKVENPPYTGSDGKVIAADDPSNPLGERWIDIGDSYGIHGTIDPRSIGKAESKGCIRMRDDEIIEVYDFLVKSSEVVIRK